MTVLPDIQYFLGANAPTGFYSLYDHLLPPERAQCIYILKGGAGCGKSTLMRRVAARARELGEPVEEILCSGDPDSLDGLLLPHRRVALVDGTAPHVVEPKFPGAVEQYLNLGDCYNRMGLAPMRQTMIHNIHSYKASYQRAYRCLAAAAEIAEDIRATLQTEGLEEKAVKRAKGILSREGRPLKIGAPGQVKQRFLSAVTHRGRLCLYNTALAQCGRVYELADSYGLAHCLLSHLLSGLLARGYDVVACPDPMAPERLEHLLVPQLSLAFLSTSAAHPLPGKPHRRIRLDAMAEQELLRRSRPRLRFYKKVSAALVEEGVQALAQAKALHDDLEALYNPHVDFIRVELLAQQVAEEIFSTPVP